MAKAGDRVYTPDEFTAKMDDFIAHCEKEDLDATDYQLVVFFDISPTTLNRYYSGDNEDSEAKDKDIYKGYGKALKKLDMYREDATIRQAKKDPRLAGHVAFKLKQPRWGGWSDKQEISSDVSIDVKINGVGKDPFA